MTKTRVAAIDGWFTFDDGQPTLLGLRDAETGTYFFPRETAVSRPPQAAGGQLEDVELGRTGKLWSYTTNHYQPPDPYVSPDPFVPYTVAAVELPDAQMVVLGQLAAEVDPADLEVGMTMELTLGTLYEDDEKEYVMWNWTPKGGSHD
jgi:uncharacterized OB-fold protein